MLSVRLPEYVELTVCGVGAADRDGRDLRSCGGGCVGEFVGDRKVAVGEKADGRPGRGTAVAEFDGGGGGSKNTVAIDGDGAVADIHRAREVVVAVVELQGAGTGLQDAAHPGDLALDIIRVAGTDVEVGGLIEGDQAAAVAEDDGAGAGQCNRSRCSSLDGHIAGEVVRCR